MRQPIVLAAVCTIVSLSFSAAAQYGAKDGNWTSYSGDQGSSRYAALDQINADNFKNLTVAWRWASADKDVESKTQFRPYHLRATPLVVNGIAYMATGMSQI